MQSLKDNCEEKMLMVKRMQKPQTHWRGLYIPGNKEEDYQWCACRKHINTGILSSFPSFQIPTPQKSSLCCGLWTPPYLQWSQHLAFLCHSLEVESPWQEHLQMPQLSEKKDYLPPLASTVGCVTLPPACFRTLPKQSVLVLGDQNQKSLNMF